MVGNGNPNLMVTVSWRTDHQSGWEKGGGWKTKEGYLGGQRREVVSFGEEGAWCREHQARTEEGRAGGERRQGTPLALQTTTDKQEPFSAE